MRPITGSPDAGMAKQNSMIASTHVVKFANVFSSVAFANS
jgi:hypothetical protein